MNIHRRHSTGRQILESVDALSTLAHLLIASDEDAEKEDTGSGDSDGSLKGPRSDNARDDDDDGGGGGP